MEPNYHDAHKYNSTELMLAVADFQKAIHEWAIGKGFYDLEVSPGKVVHDVNRNNGEMIALMHSELSEALEVLRSDEPLKPDRDVPSIPAVAVELADCIIRILDFAQYRGLDIGGALHAKHQFNLGRPYKHGKKF